MKGNKKIIIALVITLILEVLWLVLSLGNIKCETCTAFNIDFLPEFLPTVLYSAIPLFLIVLLIIHLIDKFSQRSKK